MKRRPLALVALAITAVFLAASATVSAQQPAAPADHSAHHPEATTEATAPPAGRMMDSMKMMDQMKQATARLNALVTKMNAATGAAKTDAIAELLTAIVSDRQSCETMMAEKMKAK
jgi:hypothetical protein